MMQKVVYSCPYVPAEWIAAHGLRPCRVVPSGVSGGGRVEGLCPYAQAFMNNVINDSDVCGIVVTTLCDQMRRAHDIISRDCGVPVFLMNVPKTWNTAASQRLYLDELARLGRFLVRLGGQAPSNEALADVMLAYDKGREELKAARRPSAVPAGSIPLAIVGGPLLSEHAGIFDAIRKAGGFIVLDATETGLRGMCGRFNASGLRDDALAELAAAYFGTIPDAANRPNNRLYQWLDERLDFTVVRGILFHRYMWCDIWHAELARMKEWAPVPVLDIDVGGDTEGVSAGARQRIDAFLEMLR